MATKLNPSGRTHALQLIADGKIDDSSAWDFTAADEDKILGDPPDWSAYRQWFMGQDTEADAETKAAWKYPFGKDGKVYRAALRAIRTRAAQNNETEISDAARECMDKMDEMATQAALAVAPEVKSTGRRDWYRIKAEAGAAPIAADVELYDEIGAGEEGDGITAKQFIADLNALPASVKTLRVHVNSAGGSVFEALAIANALKKHPAKVQMKIEGLAASAATIITNGAGDDVEIADNALVMIHNPFGAAEGTSKDMRATADALDRAQAAMVTTYQRLSPLGRDELTALMEAVTWMDADEAVANGFATKKVAGLKAAASLSPRAVVRCGVPKKYRDRIAAFTKGGLAAIEADLKLASGPMATSIEEFTSAVWNALRAILGDPWAVGATPWCICATYEDAVIVSRDGDYWEYPVVAEPDADEVALGKPFEVEMAWLPSAEPDSGAAARLTTVARAKDRQTVLAKKAPASFPKATAAPVADVLRICADAELDIRFAQALAAEGLALEPAQARVAAEKEARTEAKAREAEIRALCKVAKQEDLADGYVRGAMSVDDVRAHLGAITARIDKVEVESGAPDRQNKGKAPVIDLMAVYAERNRLASTKPA